MYIQLFILHIDQFRFARSRVDIHMCTTNLFVVANLDRCTSRRRDMNTLGVLYGDDIGFTKPAMRNKVAVLGQAFAIFGVDCLDRTVQADYS